MLSSPSSRQDGVGMSSTLASRPSPWTAQQGSTAHTSGSPGSPHLYPLSGIPEKFRYKMDTQSRGQKVIFNTDCRENTRELPDSTEESPTSNQPVLDTVIKGMLISLRCSLQADMMVCMHTYKKELRAVESRVEQIENKMGEFVTTINDLLDASKEKAEETEWVKLADIDDRSRRNNLKTRGLHESVS